MSSNKYIVSHVFSENNLKYYQDKGTYELAIKRELAYKLGRLILDDIDMSNIEWETTNEEGFLEAEASVYVFNADSLAKYVQTILSHKWKDE